jgi:hypothetical protein
LNSREIERFLSRMHDGLAITPAGPELRTEAFRWVK